VAGVTNTARVETIVRQRESWMRDAVKDFATGRRKLTAFLRRARVPDLRGFARRAEKVDTVNARIAALQRKLSDADDKFKRLYKLIGDGVTETDDVLKDRLNVLTEAAPEDAPGLVMRDAVEANFRPLDLSPSPRDLKLAPLHRRELDRGLGDPCYLVLPAVYP
jgi:hypothetical protein